MRLAGLFPLQELEQQQQLHSLPEAMYSRSEGSSGSSSSKDPLMARFKQLEETLEKLHRENKSLRSKVPRYNTLCTLYNESGQQLRHFHQQLSAKEATIQALRSTLAKAQATHLGAAQEGEQLVEPANSLVESLVDQLSHLKQQLRDSERISQPRVEALSQEVQRLNQQLQERDGEMQKIISQPQYEKEREILQLQRKLAEKEKVQATSEVLCRSLTDETYQLQRKLASTAEMCQQLAKCLEERKRETPPERSTQLQLPDSDASAQGTICKLQEENRTLTQKVIHVEDLNAKWQKYDASREEYVKQLHRQLKELKLQPECQQDAVPGQTNGELMMQKEILRLNRLLEGKMNEHAVLKQELENVKKARESGNERIQMLEQQVLVYKDDFMSEREDRERAQSKIQELEAEIACLQHQLNSRQEPRDTASNFRVHVSNQQHMYVRTNVEHLQGSSPDQAGVRRGASQSEQVAAAADSENSGSDRRGQGELQCPHCMRFFSDEHSEEFLRHVAECCQ
uniref:TNFAIP3-interacting protein 2 n=1 Tax=Sphenodon punctatus TaxID=8508 RepID=A0A8D0L9W4_SPHPU